jgi:hypothetical protein
MAGDDKSSYVPRRQGLKTAELNAGLLDVLIRGLEMAKRNLEADEGAEPREFCALAYGTPGTFCPLLYWHRAE